MIIFSSYSLFLHPHLPPHLNLKPAPLVSIQAEENLSFHPGNQLGLGKQTDGDTTPFTLREAQYLEPV